MFSLIFYFYSLYGNHGNFKPFYTPYQHIALLKTPHFDLVLMIYFGTHPRHFCKICYETITHAKHRLWAKKSLLNTYVED